MSRRATVNVANPGSLRAFSWIPSLSDLMQGARAEVPATQLTINV